MILQGVRDLVDILLRGSILGFLVLQLFLSALEHAEDAFFLLAAGLDLCDQIRKQIADLTQILSLDTVQRGFGELRQLLLGSYAILEDHRRIRHIDSLRELIDLRLFLRGELGFGLSHSCLYS